MRGVFEGRGVGPRHLGGQGHGFDGAGQGFLEGYGSEVPGLVGPGGIHERLEAACIQPAGIFSLEDLHFTALANEILEVGEVEGDLAGSVHHRCQQNAGQEQNTACGSFRSVHDVWAFT